LWGGCGKKKIGKGPGLGTGRGGRDGKVLRGPKEVAARKNPKRKLRIKGPGKRKEERVGKKESCWFQPCY